MPEWKTSQEKQPAGKKYQRDPSKGSNYRELISKPLQNNWFKLLEIPGEINPSDLEIDFLTASQFFL